MVRVTFRRGYLTLAGFYNPGEGATFDAATASDLVQRGIATLQEEAMPLPTAKTVSSPPSHKQITTPKGKKGAGI